MADSTWTGVCLFLQFWLSGFVGKYDLGKRISLEAQGFFRIRGNPPVADEKYLMHTNSSLLHCHCEPVGKLAWQSPSSDGDSRGPIATSE